MITAILLIIIAIELIWHPRIDTWINDNGIAQERHTVLWYGQFAKDKRKYIKLF